MSTLLTEPEVAERLRCSVSKVKRLRLGGRLTYIPGRPVLVAEADLDDYVDREKRRLAEKSAPKGRAVLDPRKWALELVWKSQIRREQRAKKNKAGRQD